MNTATPSPPTSRIPPGNGIDTAAGGASVPAADELNRARELEQQAKEITLKARPRALDEFKEIAARYAFILGLSTTELFDEIRGVTREGPGHRPPLDPVKKAKAIEMLKKGVLPSAVSRATGITINTVYYIRKRLKIEKVSR